MLLHLQSFPIRYRGDHEAAQNGGTKLHDVEDAQYRTASTKTSRQMLRIELNSVINFNFSIENILSSTLKYGHNLSSKKLKSTYARFALKTTDLAKTFRPIVLYN